MPHKENGEIDWVGTNKWLAGENKHDKMTAEKPKTKTESKSLYKSIKEKIEKEVNSFFLVHAKKFPNLTTLDELNQWVNIEAQKRHLVTNLYFRRYLAARKIGKETKKIEAVPPNGSKAVFENKKFNLTYKCNIYKIEDKW
jgi:hypothetical protein